MAAEILSTIYKFSDDVCAFTFFACELVLPIAFGIGATALGYPVSVPLSLVLGVSNLVIQVMLTD